MKNIQYIILLSIFIGFTSCVISEPTEGRATEAGKIVYNETIQTIHSYIQVLEIAQKVDFYLQSEGKKRDSIQFWLLDDYNILEVGEDVQVTGNVDWKIARNSKDSLTTPSSQWTIYTSSYEVRQAYQITALTHNSWKIVIKSGTTNYSGGSSISNAHLEFEMLTNHDFIEDFINNNYSVKMADNTLGTIINNDDNGYGYEPAEFYSNFNIITPLVLEEGYRNPVNFIEGEIDMVATRTINNTDKTESDKITAKILPNSNVSITFRGVTEVWD